MKQFLATTTVLIFIAVTGIRTANAQSAETMNVTIPFEFDISNRTLKAGDYQLRRRNEGARVVIQLIGKADQKSIYLPIHSVRGLDIQSTSKIVFHQYGDQYFLWQVWIVGRSEGQELPKTKHEQTLQRKLALKRSKAERVEIASNEK